MKTILLGLSLLMALGALGADVKITALPTTNAVHTPDIFPLVTQPGSSPVTKSATLGVIANSLSADQGMLTNGIDTATITTINNSTLNGATVIGNVFNDTGLSDLRLVYAGAGTKLLTSLPAGTFGQVLMSQSTAIPVWTNAIGDPLLSSNVPLKNGTNAFSGTNTFSGTTKITGASTATTAVNLGLDANGNVSTNASAVIASAAPVTNLVNSGIVTLTDAATIAVDASLGTTFQVTLGGNRTLGNPTNIKNGQALKFFFIQDGTGGRTLTLGSSYGVGTDITGVTLTTNASRIDVMTTTYLANYGTGTNAILGFVRGL